MQTRRERTLEHRDREQLHIMGTLQASASDIRTEMLENTINAHNGYCCNNTQTNSSSRRAHGINNTSTTTTTTMKESKVVVLGGAGVGKSSLVKQFLDGFFSNSYSPTVEDSYKQFVQLPGGLYQGIEILDTAGLHQFPAMIRLRIEAGEAFVIVYAIDNLQSYRRAVQLIDEICGIKGYETFPMVLVGNKQDVGAREVSREEAARMAENRNCAFIETSAKSNTNVHQIFAELLCKLFSLEEKLPAERRRKSSLMRRFSGGLRRRLSDEGNNNSNKAGCTIS